MYLLRKYPLFFVLSFSLAILLESALDYAPTKDLRPPRHRPESIPSSFANIPQSDVASANVQNSEIVGELVMVDESLNQVLNLLGELTEKRILAGGNLPDPLFNFDSKGLISKSDAVVALESLLELNGLSQSDLGNGFIRIIPSSVLMKHAPTLIDGPASEMKASGKRYSKRFIINFMNWEEAKALVQTRVSEGSGFVESFEAEHTLVVTDSLVNLQRIEETLSRLDVPS